MTGREHDIEGHGHDHHHHSGAAGESLVKDPVCGMDVDPARSAFRADLDGETHHFCSEHCRAAFVASPGRYLHPKTTATPPPAGALYTCPMHQEVRQSGPGSCPICGMALEPVVATNDTGPSSELVEMKRRLVIGAALAVPVVVLEMGRHLAGLDEAVPPAAISWIELLLATPVVWWAGWPFLVRGWRSVVSAKLNMFTLIALGTLAAWLYSVVATVAPGLFPAAFRAMGAVDVYFEAAAVVTLFALVGQVLELRARDRTSGAIRALLDLSPDRALRVREDGGDEMVDLQEVGLGDRLRVRPGDKVPVDGVVVEGQSTIDEAMITGEPMPTTRKRGDRVIAGSVNQDGSFVVRAERIGADTVLARIVQLVADAQRSRAPIQRLADRVSAWFVPLVIAIAVVAFATWLAVGPEPRLSYAILAAVAVLVIACPCALGLATPMSIMVGVGRGASAGLLIRDADALERLGRIDILAVDKTGTLTEGRPTVTGVVPAEGFGEADILRIAAALERGSEHPIGKAIMAAARARGLIVPPARDFASIAGRGVTALVQGKAAMIGNAALLAERNIAVAGLEAAAEPYRSDGAIAVLLAVDGEPAGLVVIGDPIRPTASAVVASLRRAGIAVVMLSGDSRSTAAAVARDLSIGTVHAGLLPAEKAAEIDRLRAEGHIVAMAGDGVNDAPALAVADIGIAMGTGTDIAMEAAGLTLLNGDLRGLLRARRLSIATMRNIRQNLFFAFLYNAAGVPLAAGVLYPVFGILLSPMIAAAAMALSSVSVIANALRLRRLDLSDD